MNVLIIATNRNRLPMPVMPLGACLVAEAVQREGHGISFLDLMFEKDPVRAVRRVIETNHPDLIGLSVRNIDNNDLHSPVFYLQELGPLLAAIRSAISVPIVLGGAAVGVMPEQLLRYTNASCCVLQDGETVFPALLGRLSRKESTHDLPGIAVLDDGTFVGNPASVAAGARPGPTPDFRRWLDIEAYLSHMSTVPMQTKLGCSFSCVYCTYRKLEGDGYRLGDPEEIAEEVTRLAASGLRSIEFVDNVFNAPREHALAICDQLSRRRHRASLLSLELNPLFIDDTLLHAMAKAGFSGVGITVESASDRVLAGLRKGFTARHVYQAAEVVGRQRLPCVWIFMFGGPGETPETVRETLHFAETRIRRSDVAFFGCGIRIYPGTELESIAREEGLLEAPAREMLEPVFYTASDVDRDWMRAEIKNAIRRTMHFMDADSLGSPLLPAISRAGYALGLRQPLWKHTALIRRSLRFCGMDV